MVLGFRIEQNGKPTGFPDKIKDGRKIHTIREDVNDRWKPGKQIQFATGVRTKFYDQFHSGYCISTQAIRIRHVNMHFITRHAVFIDDRLLSIEEVDRLAKNDGFENRGAFYEWFNKNFDGKIIHWTDFKY